MNTVKELLQTEAEYLEHSINALSDQIMGWQQTIAQKQAKKCEKMAELLEIKLHLAKMEEK
jgi:hypothetical protein